MLFDEDRHAFHDGCCTQIVAFFLLLKGAPALNESYEIYETDSKGHKRILRDRVGVVMGFAFVVGAFMAALAFALTWTKLFSRYCLRARETGSLGVFGHVNLGTFKPSSSSIIEIEGASSP